MRRTTNVNEIISCIAGVLGKRVKIEQVPKMVYSISPTNDRKNFIVRIPSNIKQMDDIVSSSLVHEALHGKHSDFVSSKKLVELLKKHDLYRSANEDFFFQFVLDLLNVSEDIRIELKGMHEYAGARRIFKRGHDAIIDMMYRRSESNCYIGLGSDDSKKYNNFFLPVLLAVPGYLSEFEFKAIFSSLPEKLMPTVPSGQMKKVMFSSSSAIKSLNELFLPHASFSMPELQAKMTKSKSSMEALRHFNEAYLKVILNKYTSLTKKDKKKLMSFFDELYVTEDLFGDDEVYSNKEQGKKTSLEKAAEGSTNAGESNLLSESKIRERAKRNEDDDDGDLNKNKLFGFGAGLTPNSTKRHSRELLKRADEIRNIAREIYNGLRPTIEEIKLWQDTVDFTPGHKRGRLNTHTLHRVKLGYEDIYYQRETPNVNDDLAFSFNIDVSGSMFQNTHLERDELSTSIGVGLGIKKIMDEIGKPASLFTFDENVNQIVKKGETLKDRHLPKIFEKCGGGTNIIDAMKSSLEDLKDATEKGKVVFTITDGNFNGGSDMESVFKLANRHGIKMFFVFINHSDTNEKQFHLKCNDVVGGMDKSLLGTVTVDRDDVSRIIKIISDYVYKLTNNPTIE